LVLTSFPAVAITLAHVQSWLDRYVAAWKSNDPDQIGALFTEDVVYRFRPFESAVVGRGAVVAAWTESPDEPDTWTAAYRAWAVTEDRAAATGETRYTDGSHFHNVFLLRFRGEECSEYTEWFVESPHE
jgi:nuclear transport factor 2 (NTF2) superfamily protein